VSTELLTVRDLSVTFGPVRAVRGLSFDLAAGSCLALVGESGSGKSVTALSLLRLAPPTARVEGSVVFAGRDLMALDEEEMRRVRGAEIAMVFQDPAASLNPVLSVGTQLKEVVRLRSGLRGAAAKARAAELLAAVGIPRPEERLRSYPHELSGGMAQRVMIAMGLAADARLLIADEPTSQLDVTVQAQIVELLLALRRERDLSLIFITHDLAVVAGIADRVVVMYAGKAMEVGDAAEIFAGSQNPYTRALLASTIRLDTAVQERLPQGISGAPASGAALPAGCPFHPRCEYSAPICGTDEPRLAEVGKEPARSHLSACHFAGRLEATARHPADAVSGAVKTQ